METTPTENANMQSLGIILASVALGIVGQLTFKAAMNNLTSGGQLELTIDTLLRMATSPLLIVGMFFYAASTGLWLLGLMKADLSFAYPFLSLTYIGVLFGGGLLFKETISFPRILGFIVIVAGLIIVARGEQMVRARTNTS